jgi:hypothetical protein
MKLSAALFFLAGLTAQSALAQSREDEPPEANPGRPTVSTPATLTPVDYLQFESGFTGAANSPQFSSRYSFNEVMKLSVIRRVELVASAEPIVHSTVGGTTGNSAGEVFVGAQGVLYRGEDARPTLTVKLFPSRLRWAGPGIRFWKSDQFFTGSGKRRCQRIPLRRECFLHGIGAGAVTSRPVWTIALHLPCFLQELHRCG